MYNTDPFPISYTRTTKRFLSKSFVQHQGDHAASVQLWGSSSCKLQVGLYDKKPVYLGADDLLEHLRICAVLQLLTDWLLLLLQGRVLGRGLQPHQGCIRPVGNLNQFPVTSLLHYLPLPHHCSHAHTHSVL